MLQYDAVNDQFVEVDFDEFSDTEDEEEESPSDTIHSLNPLLVLRRRKKTSKSRSSFIHFFNLTRIVRKSGRLNVFLKQLPHKHLSYIRDLGNTLLTLRWRWILLTLCLVNFFCYLIFSCLWMVLAQINGDFEANATTPCIGNTKTFTGYLLLSIETITTIGYGYRYPTEQCRGAWFLLMLQALFSVAIQGVLVSAVYVKTSKPFTMISSSLFSKSAVICLRDGKLRFVFRIHDFTKKIWCGTTISLYFIDKEDTSLDGTFEIQQMVIEPHGLLIFPLEIQHVINEDSPLWKYRPLDILQSRFEIVAVAEGSSTITGQVSQNRTSYSNSDILWGHRFKQCVDYDENKKSFIVNFKKFKQTQPFDTPLCSARKLAEIQKRVDGQLVVQKEQEEDEQKEEENDKENKVEENKEEIILRRKRQEQRVPYLFQKLFRRESVSDLEKNIALQDNN